MKTLTNEPTDNTFNEIVLNSAVTLTANSAGDTWTLTLPPNNGSSGQVLVTDGEGITNWESTTTGTVTSVGLSAPSFLSVSSSPVTVSGTIALGLSGTALPTSSGGTGVIGTSTGGGGVVLKENPTMSALTGTGITNFTGNTRVTGFTGDMMYIGSSIGNNTTAILRWTGTTNDVNNHFDIGFFGSGVSFEFGADGIADFSGLRVSNDIQTPEINLTLGSFTTTILTQATANWTMSLPINAGSSGQVLTTDGSGNCTWVTP